ncbi:MAG TPA: hypothetical protein DEH02_19485 [Bacteroidales bacterium]|nr:hypothetical protein [Bacteroidales bacterium]
MYCKQGWVLLIPTAPSGLSVLAKSKILFIIIFNFQIFCRIAGNGPRTGACLEYLRPTAMPVGLAG